MRTATGVGGPHCAASNHQHLQPSATTTGARSAQVSGEGGQATILVGHPNLRSADRVEWRDRGIPGPQSTWPRRTQVAVADADAQQRWDERCDGGRLKGYLGSRGTLIIKPMHGRRDTLITLSRRAVQIYSRRIFLKNIRGVSESQSGKQYL